MEFIKDLTLPTISFLVGAIALLLAIVQRITAKGIKIQLQQRQSILLGIIGILFVGIGVYGYFKAPSSLNGASVKSTNTPISIVMYGDFEKYQDASLVCPPSPWIPTMDTQECTEEQTPLFQRIIGVDVDKNKSYEGKNNAFIYLNSHESGVGWSDIRQTIRVNPYSEYKATAMVRTSSNVWDLYFGVRPDNKADAFMETGKLGPFSSAYQQIGFQFQTSGSTELTLFIGLWSVAQEEAWVLIDDVIVYEVQP